MLTIDKLKEFGANTDEGLMRCMNNAAFYLKFVNAAASDKKMELLEQQLSDKDYDAAFETAHALKGMFANLSLDPITKPVSEITDLLRSKTAADYSVLMEEAKNRFSELRMLTSE